MTAVVGDRFIPGWDPWPLTARTRFVLWVALGQLAVDLDLALQPAHNGGQSIRTVADDPVARSGTSPL